MENNSTLPLNHAKTKMQPILNWTTTRPNGQCDEELGCGCALADLHLCSVGELSTANDIAGVRAEYALAWKLSWSAKVHKHVKGGKCIHFLPPDVSCVAMMMSKASACGVKTREIIFMTV